MAIYNAAVDMVDRNVSEGRGAKVAFVDPARKLTYGKLADGAARVGPMLARLGLQREDRVAMMALDTVDFPVLFWGAIRAGVIPVPLNTLLTAEQYRYILEDARAKVLFVSAPLLAVAQQLDHHAVSYAQYRGRRGHPVGFAAELYTELVMLTGDEGARRLVARYPAQAVDVDDSGVLMDVDNEGDLDRVRAAYSPALFGDSR
jgi:acyl-CoA synthetase (AMP-forming)/AMP-acid ligase II